MLDDSAGELAAGGRDERVGKVISLVHQGLSDARISEELDMPIRSVRELRRQGGVHKGRGGRLLQGPVQGPVQGPAVAAAAAAAPRVARRRRRANLPSSGFRLDVNFGDTGGAPVMTAEVHLSGPADAVYDAIFALMRNADPTRAGYSLKVGEAGK